MTKTFKIIATIILLSLAFDANADGSFVVRSPARDSVFVEGFFAGFTPIRVMVPDGVYAVTCRTESRLVYIEESDAEPVMNFMAPVYAPGVTDAQKKILDRYQRYMHYLPPTEWRLTKDVTNVFGKNSPVLKDTLTIDGKLYFNVPERMVSLFLTGIDEWSAFMDVNENNREALFDNRAADKFATDGVVLEPNIDRIKLFLKKLRDASGLNFCLPDRYAVERLSKYDDPLVAQYSESVGNKPVSYISRGFEAGGAPDHKFRLAAFAFETLADGTTFKNYNHSGRLTNFHRTGAFRLMLPVPPMPSPSQCVSLHDKINEAVAKKKQDERALFEKWAAGAANGDAESMAYLGCAYHLGIGTEVDNDKAISLALSAADRGSTEAISNCIYYSKNGADRRLPPEVAPQVCRYMIDNKIPGWQDAQGRLAEFYMAGFGVTQSYKTATAIARKAAADGNPFGQYCLAKCLSEDDDTKNQIDTIVALYFKSVQNPQQSYLNADAYVAIGDMLCNEGAYELAVQYYVLANKNKSPEGMLKMARVWQEGIGMAVYPEMAAAMYVNYYNEKNLRYWKKAEAAYMLGRYYSSFGRSKGIANRIKWFKTAADLGHLEAQYSLALCYINNRGDYENGLDYMQMAAEQGMREAIRYLKNYYKKENPDEDAAAYWTAKLEGDAPVKRQIIADMDFAELYKWQGSGDVFSKSVDYSSPERYAHPDVATCLAAFCSAGKPTNMLARNHHIVEWWIGKFEECADKKSDAYPQMLALIGHACSRVIEQYQNESASMSDHDSLGRGFMWWWMYNLQNNKASIAAMLQLADRYLSEGLALMKKKKQTGLYAYDHDLIRRAFVRYILGDEAQCAALLREALESVRGKLIATVGMEAEARKELYAWYSSIVSGLIPGFVDINNDGASRFAELHYDCALLYKGLQTNIDCPWMTQRERIDNLKATCREVASRLGSDEMSVEVMRVRQPLSGEWYYRLTAVGKNIKPFSADINSESNVIKALSYSRNYQSDQYYKMFWAKLEPYIDRVKTIYYAPDGVFYQIPMEAVPYDGDSYVSDKWNVVRLTSTRMVLSPAQNLKFSKTLLAGGLDYGEEHSSFRGAMKAIPESGDEVKNIAAKMRAKGTSVRLFTGADGSEAAVGAAMAGNDIVHIASHGYYWRSTDLSRKRIPFIKKATPEDLPMLNSGLMLSGANATLKGQETDNHNDGVLTAKELSEIDLSSTGLAVLSACQSGVGSWSREGVAGIQKALKMAGVKSMLLSLWQIDDRAARIFMEKFYSELLDTGKLQHAFVSARNHLRNYSEESLFNDKIIIRPFASSAYWASFVLIDGMD